MEEGKKRGWLREALGWLAYIVIGLVIASLIQVFLFRGTTVSGGSMRPTLQDGEVMGVNVMAKWLHQIQRGDVVTCHFPNRGKTYFVKRVVAMPGDTVCRINGETHVLYRTEDGESVDEVLDERTEDANLSYWSYPDYEPYTLGEDEYFVVGDNRYNSHDSRDWASETSRDPVGPITGDMLVGRVNCVIWPLDGIRTIH